MSVPLEPDPSISPRIQFGTELRKFRLLSGFTQRKLGAAIHLSVSQLSMIENGHRSPSIELARQVDETLGLGTALTGLLDRLNRAAAQLPQWFRPWLDFEREAETLYIWELSMVPGLLQTEGYARALISNEPGVSVEQIEERIAARLDRQTILQRSRPPVLSVVLDESVLHRPVGGPHVMLAQMDHLLSMGDNSCISLHVLPYEAYSTVGLLGGFVVADMPGGAPAVAYIDSQSTEDRVSGGREEVRGLAFRHGVIRGDALSRRASLDMIKETRRKWTT
ncbi:helix-turn-helix transcriptional regulator [Sphaerisporangium sp. TRM90804]|uniref:helix-turn-helix domain-containing protein n=1 Tax=Sphaerisporangium sp. TRM90804 TaxID=3031113 RepID=UPI002446E921|nr:helix-turn-helix transcriptional regulator [Sphaerisporangium sp. TRM90804]MDH2428742.1 helix-turn-helix transcriptional regulator [Sphaerisporangium sp. TRM90804]